MLPMLQDHFVPKQRMVGIEEQSIQILIVYSCSGSSSDFMPGVGSGSVIRLFCSLSCFLERLSFPDFAASTALFIHLSWLSFKMFWCLPCSLLILGPIRFQTSVIFKR